mmetsp:Transcript_5208/g.13052  ORF Transcript_5208/g.13052 Transcript_5208/m.13052 type:complete len:229 (-) Transcript_5208:684-1370(-)
MELQRMLMQERVRSPASASKAPATRPCSEQKCPPRRALLLAAGVLPLQQLALFPRAARASIPLDTGQLSAESERRRRGQPRPAATEVESSERAYELFLRAQGLARSGDYPKAFEAYDDTIKNVSSESAIAQYARLGRAITRYELDEAEKKKAIIELEYEVVSFVGIPEAHAALSAACWEAKKTALAETQWEVAMEFEPRFSDLAWVRTNKHWGPELTRALESFLSLKT